MLDFLFALPPALNTGVIVTEWEMFAGDWDEEAEDEGEEAREIVVIFIDAYYMSTMTTMSELNERRRNQLEVF